MAPTWLAYVEALLAPMRKYLHELEEAHPQITDGESAPEGFAGFAGMYRRRNRGPICHCERQWRNLHFQVSPAADWRCWVATYSRSATAFQ